MEREEEIERLKDLAADAGARAVPIAPRDVVAEWVRFKCRYGCKGYAKHLSCPPSTTPRSSSGSTACPATVGSGPTRSPTTSTCSTATRSSG